MYRIFTKMWKLNNKLMGQRRNQKRIRKYFEMNENQNTKYQNLLCIAKAIFKGKLYYKFYIIKEKMSQINTYSSTVGTSKRRTH